MLRAAALLLERLPGGVAAGPRVPGTRVTLDPLERILRIAAPLPLDQGVEVELTEAGEERPPFVGERLAEVPSPPVMVRRQVANGRRQEERGRGPEHALDVPSLGPDQ